MLFLDPKHPLTIHPHLPLNFRYRKPLDLGDLVYYLPNIARVVPLAAYGAELWRISLSEELFEWYSPS